MIFNFEQRTPRSPYLEAIWRNRCETGGSFISAAVGHWAMVVTKHNGKVTLTVRGPETRATPAYCPPGAEHFGMYFKMGSFMPYLPASQLRDGSITLPESIGGFFWLQGASWQIPEYEDLEIFVDRLVREGLLVREPAINQTLRGHYPDVSVRSIQRKFLQAVGITQGAISQIERARYATILLQQGASILDVVDQAGYADQPHLTRSLKHYIGLTPAQLIRQQHSVQLSFLFKPK